MTISNALNNANSGLAAASRRADLVANNIANALTPGYARRDIAVSEKVLDGVGAGVAVTGVTRASDPVLTRERRSADGVLGRDEAIASAYAALNKALGEPDDPFSLSAQYQNFETALRDLAETPESIPLQSQTLDAAKALVATLNALSIKAQDARQTADGQIAKDVAFVNTALQQIEKLNADISRASTGGRDAAALEDQRKTLIDQVSTIIPVRELQRENGKVDLITNEGVFLLAGKAKTISFTATGLITPDLTYAGGALSGLSVDGVDITPGAGGGLSLKQGSLAGQFALRDEMISAFQGQIDSLARDVIERFEGIDATLAPGDPGLFTDAGAAFDPTQELGLAGRIAVNAAVDPARGGALWRLRDGLGAAAQGPTGAAGFVRVMLDSLTAARSLSAGAGLSGTMSAAQAAAGVGSIIGVKRLSAESAVASSQARAGAVADAEAEATGVDTDLELQKLIVIEQAFAANARVIQTTQAMIAALMEL
ncbi:MAG: flagellar hook-associated protein FlgK [Amphiplicatus sp.]